MPLTRRFVIVDDATICEARDHQVEKESRPRKRQRVDEDEVEADGGDADGYNPSAFVRDPDYYVGEGLSSDEMVVRIQRTLFKIPRSILKYSRRGGFSSSKRFDDKDPLDLEHLFPRFDPTTGVDTLASATETFRSLLWGLNVLQDPVLLQAAPRDYPEVERILQAADLARELDIKPFQAWTVDIAQRASSDPIFMDSCSSAVLRKLVEVASRADRPLIIAAVAQTWATRVLQKKAPSVPAIQIAEAYELAELRGIAYYVHLQDMAEFQSVAADGVVTQLRADPKLSNAQVLRLLSGYYSLSSFWERFRLSPTKVPVLEDGDSGQVCPPETHAKCSSVWAKRWTSAVGWKRIMGYHNADVLGLLGCLRDQLAGDDELKAGMTPCCRIAGLEQLEKKREAVRSNLASHFLGCL